MDSTGKMTFEKYLSDIPMDRSDRNIIKDILESKLAIEDNIISFKAVIPAVLDAELLCGTALRWRSVKAHFMREVRVYALSANPKTEKYMQSLLLWNSGVYLTPIPIELREVFNEL